MIEPSFSRSIPYRWSTMVLVVAVLGLLPQTTQAWGKQGHRIVCSIAIDTLNAAAKRKVEQLTDTYTTPDGRSYTAFPWACVYADDARANARDGELGWEYFERFENWHFLNVPRDARQIELRHCAWDCVIRGVEYHLERLGDTSLDDWKRAEALFFLGHWVGDLHQPLHVSFADDLGGNKILLARGSKYEYSNPEWKTSLHAVWDTRIIQAEMGTRTWQQYASDLAGDGRRGEGHLDVNDFTTWAQESYDITVDPEARYCEWYQRGHDDEAWCRQDRSALRLTEAYHNKFALIVEERLRLAGTRLAALIEQALN